MELIHHVQVDYYKSLHHVTLEKCKTFNILIGRPNVGKSNLIEALTTFVVPYMAGKSKKVSSFLREENAAQVFFNGDVRHDAVIQAGSFRTTLHYAESGELRFGLETSDASFQFDVVDLQLRKPLKDYPVFKTYMFDRHGNDQLSTSIDVPFLCPIGGNNLMRVVQNSAELTSLFSKALEKYGLKLLFNTAAQEVNILKPISEQASYIVPYSGIADTLKRYLFYAAAVVSNKESVIMFEEPEAHEYPPYVANMAQLIIQNPQNQYFITTHSPYVLNEFLESDARKDLSIHVVDYKDGETIVHTLTDEEMDEAYNAGLDFFFNTQIFFE